MQERVNLTITMQVTEPETGNEWHETLVKYVNLPYPMLLEMQSMIMKSGLELNAAAMKQWEEYARNKGKPQG